MRKLIHLAAAAAVLSACSANDESPQPEGTRSSTTQINVSWSFEGFAAGSLPDNVTSDSGRWEVVHDESAPAGPGVLAQLADDGASRFNVALCRNVQLRDLDLSVRFKAIRGAEDQGGGPIWRAKDAQNYYTCRYNPLESNFRLYKVVEGSRQQLATADEVDLEPGWHEISVSARADHLTCSLDGRRLLDIRDASLDEAGFVGLWTKADAVTHFDDLALEPQ